MIKIISEPKPLDVLVYIYNNRNALLDDDVELAIELLEKRRQQIQQVRMVNYCKPEETFTAKMFKATLWAFVITALLFMIIIMVVSMAHWLTNFIVGV